MKHLIPTWGWLGHLCRTSLKKIGHEEIGQECLLRKSEDLHSNPQHQAQLRMFVTPAWEQIGRFWEPVSQPPQPNKVSFRFSAMLSQAE